MDVLSGRYFVHRSHGSIPTIWVEASGVCAKPVPLGRHKRVEWFKQRLVSIGSSWQVRGRLWFCEAIALLVVIGERNEFGSNNSPEEGRTEMWG